MVKPCKIIPPQYQKQKSFQTSVERIFKYIKVPTKAAGVTTLELSNSHPRCHAIMFIYNNKWIFN